MDQEPLPVRRPGSRITRRVRGRIFAGLAGIAGFGVVAVYVWGILNGEATAVTAATAVLVFALGEFFRRRLAAQQYRWDKIAPQYEAFLRHVRESARATPEERVKLLPTTEKLMGEFGDKLLLWGTPGVQEAWVAMRRLPDGRPRPQIEAYVQMLRAMRREFGHQDLFLEDRDLLRVVMSDELETLIELGESDEDAESS